MLYLPNDPLVIEWQDHMESLEIRPKGWFKKELEMWSLQPGFASGIQKFPNSHRILTRFGILPCYFKNKSSKGEKASSYSDHG